MVTVYVIESEKDGIRYTGMALDTLHRLKEHNAGKSRFTKGYRPWRIIYTEQHPDWETARKREKYLKTNAGKVWLQKWLSKDEGCAGSLPA
ncbi:MAG: GIY-YIG nuclease family protein [Chitinophagaceae bacterium]|nr:GIY-YIG nuclease family protein [Chitinophagaceae bacterium]